MSTRFEFNPSIFDGENAIFKQVAVLGLFYFICSLAVILAQRGEVMLSNVLIADDQSYVVDYLLHDARGQIPNLYYLQLMVQWFGVEGSRLYLAITAALSAAAISAMLYVLFRNFIVSLAPVFALAIPASMSQYIFLNGSHPTAALPAVVAFVIFIVCLNSARNYLVQIGSTIGAMAASTLALMLTPMAPGLSLAALVFFGANLPSWREEKLRLFLLFAASFSGPLVYAINSFVTGTGRSHYLDLPGWVDPSLNRILTQLSGFFANLTSNSSVWLVAIVLVLFMAAIAVCAWLATGKYKGPLNRLPMILATFFILGGALSFGPALLVPFVQARYFEIPVFLTAIGILIFLFSMLAPQPGKLVPAAIIAITLISVAALGRVAVQDDYERITRITNQIQASLAYDFPENAQIVIVGERLPYSGFNHWSTGLLQYLTGRTDIIGLMGPTSAIGADDPIVERWVRHGQHYWFTGADGMARRKRMIGLEMGRPTFGYRFDEAAGVLRPAAVMAGDGSRALRAEHGGVFLPVLELSTASGMLCGPSELGEVALAAPPIVLGALPAPSRPGPTEFFDLPVAAAAPTVTLQAGGILEAHFHFDPAQTSYGRQEWGETYPPTPVLAQGWFQLWQVEGDYWVVASGSDTISHRGEEAEFSISFVPDCAIEVRLGTSLLRIPQTDRDVVHMTLGQGFLQRTWEGRAGVAMIGGEASD